MILENKIDLSEYPRPIHKMIKLTERQIDLAAWWYEVEPVEIETMLMEGNLFWDKFYEQWYDK